MTTLAANTPRAYEIGDHNDLPVIASDIIYEGAAVGLVVSTGHCRPLVAQDLFVGFALEKADNSAGAAAAITVRVRREGCIQLAVTGATVDDIGKRVYAEDDNSFTLTLGSPGSAYIGRVKRFVSTGICVVEYNANDAATYVYA